MSVGTLEARLGQHTQTIPSGATASRSLAARRSSVAPPGDEAQHEVGVPAQRAPDGHAFELAEERVEVVGRVEEDGGHAGLEAEFPGSGVPL